MHHANRQPRSLISMSPIGMRVLVAFEDLRSLHRELFVRAILESRSTLKVPSASLEELAHVLSHFEPHVVVCAANPGSSGAWVQIPTGGPSEDHDRLARMCLDGEHWLTEGPPLSEVLAVIDETRERLNMGKLSGAC
jgi:hypothetical protein